MNKAFFKRHEQGNVPPINVADFIAQLRFNSDGLIPVIVQQHDDKQVLMMAWMNHEALQKSLQNGTMYYWSRSRQQLWHKGETSGHIQHLITLHADCDGDALLAQVEQEGAACHTLRTSCFYWQISATEIRRD